MGKIDDRDYSPKEAKARFEAALLGARSAGPKQMTDIRAAKPRVSRGAGDSAKKASSQKKKPAK